MRESAAGPHRHRDAARHARLRRALARLGPLRARRRLVGTALRHLTPGLRPSLIASFFSPRRGSPLHLLALLVTMGLAGILRRWWWAVAAPCSGRSRASFAFVSPYLVPGTSLCATRRLVADARAIERDEGVPGARRKFGKSTGSRPRRTPRPPVSGPAAPSSSGTRSSTGRFRRAEVRAVSATKLAHLAHDDPLKGVGWAALFLIPAWGLIALLTRRQGRDGAARRRCRSRFWCWSRCSC